jgi:Sortase domain
MATGGRAALLAVLLLAPAAVAGCMPSSKAASPGDGASRATPASTSPPRAPAAAAETFRSSRDYPVAAAPVRIRIAAVGVDSALEQLGRAADGTIEVPSRPAVAGWFTEGPWPGQPGPAVILGHVDSRSGPAVFYRVGRLRAGAAVLVDRADGSTARFRVTSVSRVRKTRFPTAEVYSPTLQPSLRLVTCGGRIDPETGHYRDNVIAYAVPA